MLRSLLISSLFVFTASSQAIELVGAQGFKRYKGTTCPVIPAEYEDALGSLDRLTNHVITESGCAAVNDGIKNLEVLKADHAKFLGLIQAKKGKKLETADAEFIQDYASKASMLISNVFSAIRGSSCPIKKNRAQKAQLNETLTSIAYGIINGVSHLAGPYGTPILIGANALKGVVFGLQSLKGEDEGYTFDNTVEGEADVKAYAKSLCIFFNFRTEFENLMQPKAYYDQLLKIKDLLNKKVQAIQAVCQDCYQIQAAYLRAPNSKKALKITKKIDEEAEEGKEDLGKHTLSAVESLKWVNEQIDRLQAQQEGLRGLGPALLMEKVTALEEYLVDGESDEFMDWINERAEEKYSKYLHNTRSRFQSYMEMFLGGIVLTNLPSILYPLDRPFFPGTGEVVKYNVNKDFKSLYGFYTYLKKKYATKDHRLEDNLDSYYQKSVREMLTYKHFLTAGDEYCSFFKMSNLYPAVRSACSKKSRQTMRQIFKKEYYADPANGVQLKKVKIYDSWKEALNKILEQEKVFIKNL